MQAYHRLARVVLALGVCLMALVKSVSGIVGGHNYDFAGPSMPAGLVTRAHSFTFATYAGKDRLRSFSGSPTTAWLDDTNVSYDLDDGPVLWQGSCILDGIFAFPTPFLGIWNGGAVQGYGAQFSGQTTCDMNEDAVSTLDSETSVSFGTLAEFVFQFYLANSVQQCWYSPNSAAGASTLSSADATYNGLVRSLLWRVGFGGLGGSGSGYLCHSMLMGGASGTRTVMITVNGLPSGWVAKIKNGATTVATITGPATQTSDLRRAAGFGHSVPFGGWTIDVENALGDVVDSETGVHIGDTWTFTQATFSPSPVPVGRELIIGRVQIHHPDEDDTPHRYDASPHAIIERLDSGRRTDPRVLRFNDIVLAASDNRGRLQRTGARVLFKDRLSHSDTPLMREWFDRQVGRTLRGAETIVELNSHAGIIRGDLWFTAFRGAAERWSGADGFTTELESLAWPFQRLRRQALTKTVADLFSDEAPAEQLTRKLPLALGILSDEASVTAAPVFVADEAGRGGTLTPDVVSSYGTIGLAAPSGFSISAVGSGGNLMLGDQRGNRYYGFARHEYTGGVLGDPFPFLPDDAAALVTISTDDSSIEMECTAGGTSGGLAYVATRFYLCVENTAGTVLATQSIRTTTPATPVVFTDTPPLGSQATGPITAAADYAANPVAYVQALAVMADGRTVPSVTAIVLVVGGDRPARLAIDPVPSALEYEFYWRQAPSGAFTRKFIVPTSQVNSNSDPYWEYDGGASGYVGASDIPRPVGVIPPIHIGKFTDLEGFSDWDGFLISARPCTEYISAYIGGLRITEGDYGVTIEAPGKGFYATRFGNDGYFERDGHKCCVVFLRGPLRDAAVAAATSPSPGGTLPAVSATATIGTGNSEIVVTVRQEGATGNSYTVQVVNGVGNNQPLTVTFADPALLVTLATDGGGAPNDPENVASLVAQAISARAEFSAGVTGDGTDPVAEEGPNPFGGGADEGHLPDNPYFGEFRVNVEGLGIDGSDIGEGGGSETVITDPVDLVDILADNGFLDDPTVSEMNRLISSRSLVNTPPTFADGTSRRDTAASVTAKATLSAMVTVGNTFSRWLSGDETWEDVLAELAQSGPMIFTFVLNGAFRTVIPDPDASPSTHLDSRDAIIRGSFGFSASDQDYANAMPYGYDALHDLDGSWALRAEAVLEHTTSQTRNAERVLASEPLSMPWRSSPVAAARVAELALDESAYLPVTVTLDGGLHWVTLAPGDVISVTHPEGTGVGGYQERILRVTGLRVEIDLIRTSLTCIDLRRSVGSAPKFLLTEAGDFLLLETGDQLVIDG